MNLRDITAGLRHRDGCPTITVDLRQWHKMFIIKLRLIPSQLFNHQLCRALITDLQKVQDLTLRHRQHLSQSLILQSRTSQGLHLFQSMLSQWKLQRILMALKVLVMDLRVDPTGK